MAWPNEKELTRVRKKLSRMEGSYALSSDASKIDVLKHRICQEFVKALNAEKYSQAELARILEIDRARLNDIVKYKIHLFTVDRLFRLLEKLNPDAKIVLK